ncbi:MAG: hypothetical protein CMF80_09410 [Candidatus Marinimicrobia bacterium]|nr:hypothetical protein [Candidatus Neomarinimicrobiota bacterium]
MKIISKIFLFVLISSNLFGIEKVAYIQSIKGDVRIYSKNKLKPPIVAIIGRAIQENDIIRTYDNSECVIISKDKTTFLHLNETTEVQFIESSLSRTLNVNYGNVFLYQEENPKKNLFVFTLATQINLNNGKIWLSSNLSGDDEVYVLQNTAQIYNEVSAIGEKTNQGKVAFSTLDGFFEIVKSNKDDFPDFIVEYLDKDIQLSEFEDLSFQNLKKIKLKDWDLIPKYSVDSEEDIEPLDEGFKYDIGLGLGEIKDNSFFEIAFIPIYHKDNFRMAYDLSYNLTSSNDVKINHFGSIFDIIDKVIYFDYFSSNGKLFVHIGDISKITFGYGQLVRNYRNTYGYPHLQKTGMTTSIEIKENFLDLEFFISDVEDFSNGGPLVGIKSNIFLSENFPLDIEVGIVSDLNQYANYATQTGQVDSSRSLYGFNLNLNYQISKNYYNAFYLFFDMVSLFYPENRVFYREYREVERQGSFSFSFPGITYTYGKNVKISGALHYNSSLYEPGFFNSTYDLFRVQNIKFDTSVNEQDTLYNYLMNKYPSLISNDQDKSILVTKDLHSIINNSQNTFESFGVSFDIETRIQKIGGLELYFQHLMENVPDDVYSVTEVIAKTYQTIDFRLFINEGVILKMNRGEFYLSQYNEHSGLNFSSNSLSNNTSMGFSFDFQISDKINLIFDLKDTFYDINYNGLMLDTSIEKVRSLNCDLMMNF